MIIAMLYFIFLGVYLDASNKYCTINESTTMEGIKRYCVAFGKHYQRKATRANIERQLAINAT
jgi:hypothetical protein